MAEIIKGSNSTAAIDKISTGASLQGSDQAPSEGKTTTEITNKDGEQYDLKIATALRMGKVTNDLVDIEGGVRSDIILTNKDRENSNNIINEAVEKKMADKASVLNKITMIPVVGLAIRPVIMAGRRAKAARAVKLSGDDSSAFTALGLEASSTIGMNSNEAAENSARLALEKSGFADMVDSSNSNLVLNKGEKVEKVSDPVTENVNGALKDLYKEMESAYKSKDSEAMKLARERYDEQLKNWQKDGVFGDNQSNIGRKILESKLVMFVAGDHSKRTITELEGLRKAADGVEDLVKHNVSMDAFNKYLDDGNLSLYNASIKEGVNTKRKVDSVLAAVAAGGVIGGIVNYKLSVGARADMKSKVGTQIAGAFSSAATGAITGAAAGAVFGAVRGVGRSMEKLSKAEIADVTSGEAILTAAERAELAKAAATEAATKAAEEANREASESENSNTEETEAATDNENGVETGNNNTNVVRSARGKIFSVVDKIKKKATGEEKYAERINEMRNRKNAKELYDALERDTLLLDLARSENKDGFRQKMREMKERNDGTLEIALNGVKERLEAGSKGLNEDQVKALNAIVNKLKNGEINKKDANKIADFVMDNNFRNGIEKRMKNTIVDIRARENLTNKSGTRRLNIDLIRYSEGNVDRERSLLREKMVEANEMLGENGVKADDPNIAAKVEELRLSQRAVKVEQIKFALRHGATSALTGAAMGTVFGALAAKGREVLAARDGASADAETASENGNAADAENPTTGEATGATAESATDLGETANTGEVVDSVPQLVDEDGDGIYELKVGSETVLTEGDGGITFDPETGKMSDSSMELLRSHGFEISETSETSIAHGARTTEGIYEYFKSSNSEAYGEGIETGNKLVDVDIKGYISTGDANRAIDISQVNVENDGDLVFSVTPKGEGIDVDSLQVVLSPNKELGNVGIVLDVAPDGTVTVPAGSAAASMFADGGSFSGGALRVVQDAGEGGGYNVLGTSFGSNNLTEIGFNNPVEKITYDYSLNGAAFNVPGEATVDADLARAGIESMRNSGPVEYTYQDVGNIPTEEISGPVDYNPEFGRNYISVNGAADSDSFELLQLPHREGNYSEALDPFLSDNKEGNNLLGENLVRQMIDPDYEMSAEEADNAFIEAINSGRLSTNQIFHHMLEAKGNSPEGIVGLRAKLGDFRYDIDGDGTEELIDTQEEINAVADILKNSAEPEGYSAFVNDTYEVLFDKMNGGEVRVVNYADVPYRYTELGFIDKATNNITRLFSTKKSACSGLGLEFLDKDGRSVYDENAIRSIYRIPAGERIGMISDRLECGDDTQTTVQTFARVVERAVVEQETQASQPTQSAPTQTTTTTTTTTTTIPDNPTPTGPTPDNPTPDNPTPEIPIRPGKGANTHAGDENVMGDTNPVTAENRIVYNENPGSENDRLPGSEIIGENANIATEGAVTDANGNPLTDANGNTFITNGQEGNVGENIAEGTQTTFSGSTEGRVEGAASDVAAAMGGNTDNAAAEAARQAAEEAARAADQAAAATSGAGLQTEVTQAQAADIYQNIASNPGNEVAQ